MTIEHWAEYWHPGSLFAEDSHKQLRSRSTVEALAKMPNSAFAFRLYDVRVLTGTLEDGSSTEKRTTENESKTYYPGGAVYDVEGIRSLDGDHRILISNMEGNDWPVVVKTRLGNFQPFENAEIVTAQPPQGEP